MAGGASSSKDQYSRVTAGIYVYNLIVGAGALALPMAMYKSGLALGIICLVLAAFLSYVTSTFMLEAMAAGNAVIHLAELNKLDVGGDETATNLALLAESYTAPPAPNMQSIESTETPLLNGEAVVKYSEGSTINANLAENPFTISRRIEMGQLSEVFTGKLGRRLFYTALCIYLWGDLCIYAAAVPYTLASFTGGFALGKLDMGEKGVYYFWLFVFILCLTPWCFFNFQKTKYLQLVTLATRNIAFFMMIILGFVYIHKHGHANTHEIPLFKITGFSAIYGVAVYAFMCHHSLPGMITPISRKEKMSILLFIDYVFVLISYLILCVTAIFAFGNIEYDDCPSHPGHPCKLQSLYTLNFASYDIRVIAGYLELFPVFTLTSSFPLICITLRNNIRVLIEGLLPKKPDHEMEQELTPRQDLMRRMLFGCLAATPPYIVAFFTHDVRFLVNITGSFAGIVIQYVIPACLVLYSRKEIRRLMPDKNFVNTSASPFQHSLWVIGILTFSMASFIYTFVNLVTGSA